MMEPKTVTTTSKYPEKPITLIVPYSAGGGLDLIARSLEKRAFTTLGQSLIIINKPGGGGTIGWNELVHATPDGYTIGMSGADLILQSLYDSTKYNYPTALEPIVQITSSPSVMVVQSEKPWQNVDDLVRYAQQHPRQLKFAHNGTGSILHVHGEMFAQATNIAVDQVPFNGSAEALVALLGGHVQVMFINPATIKEHFKNGTVRVLAVTSDQRLVDPVFANVPTFKELGMDIVFSYWAGVAAPKEMSVEVKTKLAGGLKAIVNDPEFQKEVENMGMQVEYLDPQESQRKWLDDNQKLSKIVRETGILEQIKEQKK